MDKADTVFVVDDDALLCKVLALLLQTEGFNVEAYTIGPGVSRCLSAGLRGCVILDIGLPDMDGLALQQALAARDIRLPIIFLTGQGDIPKTVQAMQDGAVDFLEKPANDVGDTRMRARRNGLRGKTPEDKAAKPEA